MCTKKYLIFFLFVIITVSCKQTNEQLIKQGIAFQDQAKYKEAIETYSKVLSRNNKFQLVHYNRGVCYIRTADYPKAFNDFNKIISLQTHDGWIVQGNPDSPIADEETGMEIPYDNAFYLRAQAKYFMDSLVSAYYDFQRLINKNYEEKVFCMIFQGDIWHQANHDDSACQLLETARKLATKKGEIEESDKLIRTYCEKDSNRQP